MRLAKQLCLFAVLVAGTAACDRDARPDTPVEALKAYITAAKKKDTTRMKLLLSNESIKMHEQEAKSQNITLDDVVKRDSLLDEGQKVVEFRNERINGESATVELKNSFGSWETVSFVREDGRWKIDKKSYADQMIEDVEKENEQLDAIINQGRPVGP